jgi:nicotinic acid mononucleotide adenylyltransferase
MRRAASQFSLDRVVALAGKTNADKTRYESSLEDRLRMLDLALGDEPWALIGISSHPYFVDMTDAFEKLRLDQSGLSYIVGMDTFERLLDPESKYLVRYHLQFADRLEALDYLLSKSRLIVAGRSGAGIERFQSLTATLPVDLRPRILHLDFPSDLGEMSATEVRERVRSGQPIDALVPAPVNSYITKLGLYRKA